MAAFVATFSDHESLASTSDQARALVVAGEVALPLLVRARRQTQGRGRGANAWWSDAGSLTFTLAIDPLAHGLSTRHEPRLALTSALAMIDAIGLGVPAGIRWPNDIEANGRKLGGILPERVETTRGVRLLIGLGLNVRTRLNDAPADVRAMAASLADWGEPPTLDAVLGRWLSNVEDAIARLASDDPALASRWAALDTLRGESVRVDLGPRVVAGIAGGIDPEGALIVATPTETLRLFGGRVLRG